MSNINRKFCWDLERVSMLPHWNLYVASEFVITNIESLIVILKIFVSIDHNRAGPSMIVYLAPCGATL